MHYCVYWVLPWYIPFLKGVGYETGYYVPPRLSVRVTYVRSYARYNSNNKVNMVHTMAQKEQIQR